MRHRVKKNKLSRSTSHRRSLARNVAVSLIEHERIETTLVKAKAHRPFVEKLVSLGREKNLHNFRRAMSILGNHREAVRKLFEVIGPRFKDRPGGYTRVLRLATPRLGDKADRAIFEFVERSSDATAGPVVEDEASTD